MLQRALQHEGDDLHVRMRVRRKAAARCHAILVDHQQTAEAGEARVMIAGEGEGARPAVELQLVLAAACLCLSHFPDVQLLHHPLAAHHHRAGPNSPARAGSRRPGSAGAGASANRHPSTAVAAELARRRQHPGAHDRDRRAEHHDLRRDVVQCQIGRRVPAPPDRAADILRQTVCAPPRPAASRATRPAPPPPIPPCRSRRGKRASDRLRRDLRRDQHRPSGSNSTACSASDEERPRPHPDAAPPSGRRAAPAARRYPPPAR